MLSGHHLVYFGPEKWKGLWRNRHQLMSRYARQNKVLYIEPYNYLKGMRHQWREGTLGWQDLEQDLKQRRVTKAADNLYIYRNPLFIPISGRYPLDRITWSLWTGLLRSTMQRLGFAEPILWLSRPNMVNLIGRFNEKLTIYHVVDEYLSYTHVQHNIEARQEQQALEQQMLEKTDLVIVVSEKLLQAKRPSNPHTYLVPNGVDYQAYTQALDSQEPLPPDIAQLPKPIIGYSGLVGARLDLDLLHHLATLHPEWSIALVGAINDRHCAAGLNKLRQKKNIHFLGRKEIHQVPYYVKGFDVCLVPYTLNERAQNSSPLKLYDYMATGKPIVTTNFAAAGQFEDVIRIANSKKEFTRCIEEILSGENNGLCSKRRRIAAQNTWEDRITQQSVLIQSHLNQAGR